MVPLRTASSRSGRSTLSTISQTSDWKFWLHAGQVNWAVVAKELGIGLGDWVIGLLEEWARSVVRGLLSSAGPLRWRDAMGGLPGGLGLL